MRLELRNLPKKPEPRMDTSGHIWTHLDSLDTPDMEQPDFAWPTNLEEESHPNQVSLQEEVSWNNNPQMLDQLFHGSLLEEEQQPHRSRDVHKSLVEAPQNPGIP